MRKMRISTEKGFTIVEAMLAIVLFSMLFGATLMIYLAGSESWQTNSAHGCETQVTPQKRTRDGRTMEASPQLAEAAVPGPVGER